MGYTGTFTDLSAADYLRDHFTHGTYTVVANRGAKYWVLHNSATDRNFAVVALVKKTRDGYLTYKTIDETSGPGDFDFPLSLLGMLHPEPENDWSAEWREKVRQYHAAKNAKPKLEVGDTVRFSEPLRFTSGSEHDTLTYAGGYRFTVPGYNYYTVRLSKNWRTRYDWTVTR